MNKPKIGVLTTFTGSDEAYSLVVVVKTQLEMLVEAGYNPVLFVAPSFTGEGIWAHPQVEIRKTVMPDATTPEIKASLQGQIKDIDVMLCHDIVFLEQHRHWANAVRIIAKESPIKWIHWQHSRGDHNPIGVMPNSEFCYPNTGDLEHVAIINSTSKEHVHYVPHPLDFDYLGWPELSIRIAEDYSFPFVDVSMIYPTRLDRQKQVEKAMRVFAGIKKAGKSICLLVADSYATGDRFLEYKKDCMTLAGELGFTDKEFAFLGATYEECTYGTPRQTVKALYEMSNLFLQVSNCETSSLVAMEAALAGNLLVLNGNFKPIHHLYTKALALEFGSIFSSDLKYWRVTRTVDGGEVKVEDEQFYFDDHAKSLIIPMLDSQITISVRRQQLRERWPSRVFKEYMEPLLLKDWTPSVTECTGDPQVTAIITTMDNLSMLKRQISVLIEEVGQIIVVNNGSKDDTKQWLDENPVVNMKVIHRENHGAGPGRNAGLALWDENPTVYTLMIDGGIRPPGGGVKLLKEYLNTHPQVSVISPEVETCFIEGSEEWATHYCTATLPEGFEQRCLSSTAYCLCRAEVWRVRFSEEGPFGEPGWGVDDNDMAYRWDEKEIIHHDFTHSASGWLLPRRSGGSHQRLFEETGIWPTQYGSVYEKRNVKCLQDWRALHAGIYGKKGTPTVSYIVHDIKMPEFAMLVKTLHEKDLECEVLASDYDPLVIRWLDMFALRWPHGDATIDPEGRILRRGVDYPENLWSGDVVRNRGPISENVVTINKENVNEYL